MLNALIRVFFLNFSSMLDVCIVGICGGWRPPWNASISEETGWYTMRRWWRDDMMILWWGDERDRTFRDEVETIRCVNSTCVCIVYCIVFYIYNINCKYLKIHAVFFWLIRQLPPIYKIRERLDPNRAIKWLRYFQSVAPLAPEIAQ